MDNVEKEKLLEILKKRNSASGQAATPEPAVSEPPVAPEPEALKPVAAEHDAVTENHPPPERRQYKRVKFDSKIKVLLSSGEEVWVYCDNISLGGLLLHSPYPADVGTPLHVIIPLNIDGKAKSIKVKTQVTHDREGTSPTGPHVIGLKFLDLNPECAKLLNLYIDIKIKRGLDIA